ncbi:hypothetical protein [Cylindrospermopsis raciborskii]|uniref:hypothetical protein n=1 Tax=Cylindrospermopsis raciborskii TaxID=77022 RepID=UPI00115F842C|nr:hypothetical protein [Cylindrospermopsis raciborskii]
MKEVIVDGRAIALRNLHSLLSLIFSREISQPIKGRLRSTPYGRSQRTSNLETVCGGDRSQSESRFKND